MGCYAVFSPRTLIVHQEQNMQSSGKNCSREASEAISELWECFLSRLIAHAFWDFYSSRAWVLDVIARDSYPLRQMSSTKAQNYLTKTGKFTFLSARQNLYQHRPFIRPLAVALFVDFVDCQANAKTNFAASLEAHITIINLGLIPPRAKWKVSRADKVSSEKREEG